MPERETIVAAIEPVLAPLGLELFDVQFTGSGRARTVRVMVDRDGGVDLDAISAASERIQPALDALADLGPYALEVSSPGLERPLHRPEHFRRAVGENVSVKVRGELGKKNVGFVFQQFHLLDHLTVAENLEVPLSYRDMAGSDGEVRRLRGELVATDERGVTVHVGDNDLREHADYEQIIKARTVFEWGAAPKTPKRAKKKQQKEVAR